MAVVSPDGLGEADDLGAVGSEGFFIPEIAQVDDPIDTSRIQGIDYVGGSPIEQSHADSREGNGVERSGIRGAVMDTPRESPGGASPRQCPS
ncbi:MAG: hypothetical protein ACOX20_00070 [Limnochordia bacterium]